MHGAVLRGAFCALWCALFAVPAAAGDDAPRGGLIHEFKIGALLHDNPYMWSGFNKEPYSADLNVEVQFGPGLSFWHGTIRPVIGTTVNFAGYTSKAYAAARLQWEYPSRSTFFALGLGVAYHDGNTLTADPNRKLLGSSVLFHDSIEFGYRFDQHRSISIYFEHISNLDFAPKNQGLDAIGLRYGYRF
jgi:hypothetical protein